MSRQCDQHSKVSAEAHWADLAHAPVADHAPVFCSLVSGRLPVQHPAACPAAFPARSLACPCDAPWRQQLPWRRLHRAVKVTDPCWSGRP
jgi:hypothetical protein